MDPFANVPASAGPTNAFPGIREGQYTLSNAQVPCERISAIAPALPAEAGHLAGAALTPPRYPFVVDAVQYSLEEAPDIPTCNSTFAHRVELTVLNQGALPARPSTDGVSAQVIMVPDSPGLSGRRVIRQILETPITLEEGQRLLISVSLEAQGSEHLCIAVCEDQNAVNGGNFWSNAAGEPYQWSDLTSFGIFAPLVIEATGDIVPSE